MTDWVKNLNSFQFREQKKFTKYKIIFCMFTDPKENEDSKRQVHRYIFERRTFFALLIFNF